MQFLFLLLTMKIDEFRNRMLTDMKHTTPKVYINFSITHTHRPIDPRTFLKLLACGLNVCLKGSALKMILIVYGFPV